MIQNNNNLPLTYALNQHNEMKYVLSVDRGSKCGCRCPHCGEPLDAKKGYGGHTPHFAHQSGRECKGAYMSALHLLAEQIIERNKAVMAPAFKKIIESRKIEFVVAKKEGQIEWKQIKPKEWGNIKPDVIGVTADGKKWAIEIFYTNEVDDLKNKKIIDYGISCLEIDVRKQNLEGLEHFILNSSDDRWWINNPNYEQIFQEKVLLKIKLVTQFLLEKKELELPEFINIKSKVITINSSSLSFSSEDGLINIVKISAFDGSCYVVYIGTHDSIKTCRDGNITARIELNVNELLIYVDDIDSADVDLQEDLVLQWVYNDEYHKSERKKLLDYKQEDKCRKEISNKLSRTDNPETVDYSFPSNCDSLEDYYDFLLNYPHLEWKGKTHYATEIELSPNHNELLVVHYNESRKMPPYHITVFYCSGNNVFAQTITDNHIKIMEYFSIKKEEWENEDLPFPLEKNGYDDMPF